MDILSQLPNILAYGKKQWDEAKAVPLALLEDVGPHETAGDSALPGLNSIALADNLGAMKACAEKGFSSAFNLIYVDPPFFSKHNYETEIKLQPSSGEATPALRLGAYDDAWSGGMGDYLRMLVPRLFGIHELLAADGCFWMHLDWHAAHYAKVLLDAVFGEDNFVNEVVWHYKSGGVSRRRFARKHDTLLFYSKTSNYYFKPQQEKSYNRGLKPYRFKGVKEYQDETGWFTMVNMKDVWQLDMVGRTSKERTGYTTQKPESLILRILESCTKPGDLCGDFFGGSGTLAAAAEKLGRRWFLCDNGPLAVIKAQKRMAEAGSSFKILAEPRLGVNSPGLFDFELDIREESPTGKKRVAFKLTKYALPKYAAPLPVEERYWGIIHDVLENDSLQLVDYWGIDTDYDGVALKATAWKGKTGARIEDAVELAVGHVGVVAIRVVDIFGNSSLVVR